jgi:RNA polymerase sigma-70 factor (ECF subfamily)
MADSASATGSTFLVLLRDPSSPDGWRNFVARYGPRIFAWCQRWSVQPADAENVTQEVLLKLVRRLPSFTYDPAKGGFRAWLKTVTRNALNDYREAQQRGQAGTGSSAVVDLLLNAASREDLLEHFQREFDLELLDEAKARTELQVSRRDWRIFQALAIEGRTGAEVAAELGMKPFAVFKAKSRVQQVLAVEVARLKGDDTEEGTP